MFGHGINNSNAYKRSQVDVGMSSKAQIPRVCLHLDDILVVGDLIALSFRRFKHSSKQGPQGSRWENF